MSAIPTFIREFALYSLDTQIVLKAASPASTSKVLVFDRASTTASLLPLDSVSIPSSPPTTTGYALFGQVTLPSGPYLILSTVRKPVATFFQHAIYNFGAIELVPIAQRDPPAVDAPFLTRLKAALSQGFFYGSYTWNLTKNLSRSLDATTGHTGNNTTTGNNNTPTPTTGSNNNGTSNDSFFAWFWNHHLASALPTEWCLPLIRGFVSPSSFHPEHQTQFLLISRQSPFRAGTRYNRRGADVATAHVANMCETEQIVVRKMQPSSTTTTGTAAGSNSFYSVESMVQLRGSIPLHWSQRANIQYKPKPVILSDEKTNAALCETHMKAVSEMYRGAKVVCVDLVDQKGSEGVISGAYRKACQSVGSKVNVQYLGFDFHKKCAKMQYSNLDELVGQAKAAIEASIFRCDVRWDAVNAKFEVISSKNSSSSNAQQQSQSRASSNHAILRTNCMDCLDRTNVTQAYFARTRLASDLASTPALDLLFKHAWADNGDALATLYAGTGALKTDFTRTGKRTRQGALMDGVNSAKRYFLNNFRDGLRQDGVDLLTGKVVLKPGLASYFAPTTREDYGTFLLALMLAAIAGMVFVHPLLFMVVLVVLLAVARKMHHMFVNRPRLIDEQTTELVKVFKAKTKKNE
jgi:hypothetical protein